MLRNHRDLTTTTYLVGEEIREPMNANPTGGIGPLDHNSCSESESNASSDSLRHHHPHDNSTPPHPSVIVEKESLNHRDLTTNYYLATEETTGPMNANATDGLEPLDQNSCSESESISSSDSARHHHNNNLPPHHPSVIVEKGSIPYSLDSHDSHHHHPHHHNNNNNGNFLIRKPEMLQYLLSNMGAASEDTEELRGLHGVHEDILDMKPNPLDLVHHDQQHHHHGSGGGGNNHQNHIITSNKSYHEPNHNNSNGSSSHHLDHHHQTTHTHSNIGVSSSSNRFVFF